MSRTLPAIFVIGLIYGAFGGCESGQLSHIVSTTIGFAGFIGLLYLAYLMKIVK